MFCEHEKTELYFPDPTSMETYRRCVRCQRLFSGGEYKAFLLERKVVDLQRLLNNWLAWYEMGGGSLGALKEETKKALMPGRGK